MGIIIFIQQYCVQYNNRVGAPGELVNPENSETILKG